MSDKRIHFSPGSQARKIVQYDFESEKWKTFKKWFFESYSSTELKTLSNEFYELCEQKNKILFFVLWFISTYVEKYISTIDRNYKLSKGRNVIQIYPPQQPFQIEKNGTSHDSVTFAKLLENETFLATCKQMGLLNNYSNLYSEEHLSSLKNKVEQIIKLTETQSVIIDNPIQITKSKTIGMIVV